VHVVPMRRAWRINSGGRRPWVDGAEREWRRKLRSAGLTACGKRVRGLGVALCRAGMRIHMRMGSHCGNLHFARRIITCGAIRAAIQPQGRLQGGTGPSEASSGFGAGDSADCLLGMGMGARGTLCLNISFQKENRS